MKKYVYTAGAVAVAAALTGLPALAFAQSGSGVSVGATVQVQGDGTVKVDGGGNVTVKNSGDTNSSGSASTGASAGDKNTASSDQGNQNSNANGSMGQQMQGASGQQVTAQEQTQMQEQTQAMEHMRESEGLPFKLQSTTTPVYTAAQLQLSIKNREQQLNQEMLQASSSDKLAFQNANPVRLAVHTFLASKEMLGSSIGAQVAQVAQQMNSSLASTTKAQMQIAQRGFWTGFFFGGDVAAANEIDAQVAQNKVSIQKLNQLMTQASVSAQVKTQLEAQLTVLEQEQVRLQTLAQQQKSAWGLFSWRF